MPTDFALLSERLRLRVEAADFHPAPETLDELRQFMALQNDWLDAIPNDRWVYFVPGIWHGDHVLKLFERIPPGASLVLMERDAAWLRSALLVNDFGPAAMSRRCILVEEDDPAHLAERLALVGDKLCRKPLPGAPSCIHTCEPIADYDLEWWSKCRVKLADFADTLRTAIFTQLCNAKCTDDNVLDNLPLYAATAGLDEWHNLFQDKPAVLVAAGPSVDQSLEILVRRAELRDRYILISCLTMLKPLLQRGIVPDFVTALDYHEISGRFLEGIETLPPGIKFVLEPKVNHAVTKEVERLKAPVYFLWNEFALAVAGPFNSYDKEGRLNARALVDGSAQTDRAALPPGATVAHLSMDLAEYLGCSPLIFIGQDLGFRADKYYPDCVYAAHPWKDSFKQRLADDAALRLVEGRDGAAMYQDEQMHCYLQHFECRWKTARAKCIDCTEGGVKKIHIEAMPLEATLDAYCLEPVAITTAPFSLDESKRAELFERLQDRLPVLTAFCDHLAVLVEWYGKMLADTCTMAQAQAPVQAVLAQLGDPRFDALPDIIEHYSGSAPMARHWLDTEAAALKLEGEALKQHAIKRDALFHAEMFRAGCALRDKIKSLLEKNDG